MGDPKHPANAPKSNPPHAKPKSKPTPEPVHPEIAPELIRVDEAGPPMTIYLDVKAMKTGGEIRGPGKGGMVGVFVPKAVAAADKINVILYIHGNKVLQDGHGNREWHTEYSIDQIWSNFTFPVRDQLEKSGRPFVLIAPTLGAKDQSGQMGDNPALLLEQAMTGLKNWGPKSFRDKKAPEVGDIVLAGHSGAGPVMLQIANSLGKYKANLKEVWGFDVMYGDNECGWAGLAGSTRAPMYFYYNDTARRSKSFRKLTSGLDNVFVMRGDESKRTKGKVEDVLVEHDFLVQRFFSDRLSRFGGKNPDDDARRKKVDQALSQVSYPACSIAE